MTVNGALVAGGAALALALGLTGGYPAGVTAGAVGVALLLLGLPVPPLPGRALRLTLSADRVTVERDATVTVTIVATGRAVARLRTGEEPVTVAVGGRPAEWASPPLARGLLTVEVDRVEAVGLLALWRRRIPCTAEPVRITVLPRHVELAEPPEVVDLDRDGQPSRIGVGASFAGLRAYEPGDDLRHVDWAASARSGSGDLVVRHFAPALAEDRVVVFDPRLPAGPGGRAAFEVAVDLAYSFALAGVDLVVDGEAEPVRGLVAARAALTVLRPRAGAVATPRPDGVVAVITAAAEHAEELRRAYGDEVLIVDTGRADLAMAAATWSRGARR